MVSADLLARMCRARNRLQAELEAPVPVRQLAREAGLTAPHFITLFSGLFGMTPLQCRTRARMARARELLARSDEPATQIGLSLGFQNSGSFSRRFARQFGLPPREFRKQAPPPEQPAGCVALMNLAWGRQDRNFGEVAGDPAGHDEAIPSPDSRHANQPHQPLRR